MFSLSLRKELEEGLVGTLKDKDKKFFAVSALSEGETAWRGGHRGEEETKASSLCWGKVNSEIAMAGLSPRDLWKIILGFNADVIWGERFILSALSILHSWRHFNFSKRNMPVLMEGKNMHIFK